MPKTKRNKKILLIALLMLLTAMSSVLIGTLAKYATTGTATDAAVAATFGLNVPTTINLFAQSYGDTVEADEAGKKIVAPGTKGVYAFSVTGTSEVAYQVSAKVEVTYSEDWEGYKPLRFSLDDQNWADLAEFETLLSEALAAETMAPNEAYSSTQKIYWQWPFHTSAQNDLKDTAVGAKAAGGTALTVTVKIEVTAVQLD